MIVPLTHHLLEELTSSIVDPEIDLRGFAYIKNGEIKSAFPILPLEIRGWGSDGIVGDKNDRIVVSQLLKHVLEDLQQLKARILIVFDEVPDLTFSGHLHMLEAKGQQRASKLEVTDLLDNSKCAELVKLCQQDSQDFEGIPSCEDVLDPYRGYGTSLWKNWQDKGVLLINSINEEINHLAFVGLLPEARHQGVGGQLISLALSLTGTHKTLTVAVDSRNKVACQMYRRKGFVVKEIKKVYFKDFTSHNL